MIKELPGGRDAWGKAGEPPCPLQAHHPPSASVCSLTLKLSEPILLDFYGGFNTQAWLIKSLALGD